MKQKAQTTTQPLANQRLRIKTLYTGVRALFLVSATTAIIGALVGCTAEIQEQMTKEQQELQAYPYETTFRELFGLPEKGEPPLSPQEEYAIKNGCDTYLNNTRTQTYNGVEDSYVYIKCPQMPYPNQQPQRFEGR